MTALDVRVQQGFIATGIPPELVKELLEAFTEAKRRFYRDDLRSSSIEGARFSEAMFRILEWATTQQYTPLGGNLPKVPSLMSKLEQAEAAPESVRVHIPRTLRLICDMRNKRDVAHLGDGIDPNQQDATIVVRNMEWVLAELERLHHNVSATEAHGIIVPLVSREVPLIQVFDGFPRVLKQLTVADHMLVLLYWRGVKGATFTKLHSRVGPAMRANFKRTLNTLNAKDLTHLGEWDVEQRDLLEPQ